MQHSLPTRYSVYDEDRHQLFQYINDTYHILDQKMNTLKGIFNTQRPVHRKNFIQENVRQLRDMQICWQNREEECARTTTTRKFKKVMPRVPPHVTGIQSKYKQQSHHTSSAPKGRASKSAPPKPLSTSHSSPVSQASNAPLQKASKPASSETRKGKSASGMRKDEFDERLPHKGDVGEFLHQQRPAMSSEREVTSTSSDTAASVSESVPTESIRCPTPGECTSRGCQTIDPSNMDNLYSEGVIKYPSSRKSPERIRSSAKRVPTRDMGLQTEDLGDTKWQCSNIRGRTLCSSNNSAAGDVKCNERDITALRTIEECGMKESTSDFEEESQDVDYIKLNARNVANKRSTGSTNVSSDHLKAPQNYQKGAIPNQLTVDDSVVIMLWTATIAMYTDGDNTPGSDTVEVCIHDNITETTTAPVLMYSEVLQTVQYLRERQEEWQKAAEERLRNCADPTCPPGHVPLPESDRKETLKMLRKSYADLVQELNMMPVRSDTLKTRQRKIELEKQLNKLEDGIKVFSRPKVYVKVGA